MTHNEVTVTTEHLDEWRHEIVRLLEENKRLKKLAYDLQREIERHVLAEIHPMEDK